MADIDEVTRQIETVLRAGGCLSGVRSALCVDASATDTAYNRGLGWRRGRPSRKFEGDAQVARIAGVNIPNQKRVPIGLTYIHGIGRTKADEICERVGIPAERRVQR